jgi:hypothetical protein
MVSVLTAQRPTVARRETVVAVDPLRASRRADVLWVGAWAAWVVALLQINLGAARGPDGLLGALPLTFFLAMTLLCVSVCVHLQRPTISPLRLGAHVVSLAVMLQAPLPILYDGQARYYTQFKAVGETLYFSQHQGFATSVDIYQRWPGFFTLFSWFDKVAGLQSPLSYLAWSEIGFDLLFVLAFYFAAGGLGLNPRQRWLATFLFLTGDWVATQGQDFYTPQALGFFLVLIVVGLLLRAQERSTRVSARHLARAGPWRSSSEPDRLTTVVAVLLYATVLFTHPLSPFVLVAYTLALTLVGRLRPVWLCLLFAGLALLYLAPNVPFLSRTGGLGIGHILGNAAPAGIAAPVRLGPNHLLLPLLTGLVFGLGVIGIYRRWRVRDEWRSMVALLVSPIALLAVVHYGDETSYRVLLFSMPWAIAGAASLFYNSDPTGRAGWASRWAGPVLVTVIVTLLSLGTNYSQTELYQSSAQDVAAAAYLNQVLPPGVVIYLDDEFPTGMGGNYPAYLALGRHGIYYQPELINYPGFFAEPAESAAGDLARSACGFTRPGVQPVYVVFSRGQERLLADFHLISNASLQRLSNLLVASPLWKVSYANQDVTIFSPVKCG